MVSTLLVVGIIILIFTSIKQSLKINDLEMIMKWKDDWLLRKDNNINQLENDKYEYQQIINNLTINKEE